MTTQQEYLHRRNVLFAKMLPASAAIFFSAPEVIRNADASYLYRQNSDFSYLTGFHEPQSVLLLIKTNEMSHQSILFNRIKEWSAEIWSGRRLGQAAAPEALAVDRALPFDDIPQQLPLLLNGLGVIYHAQGEYSWADGVVFAALETLRKGARQNLHAVTTLTDWRPWLHEMRLIKSAQEITLMQRAAEITVQAHIRAMERCRFATFEYQLEAEIHHQFTCNGARYPAYNTIVAGGENGCILHYTDNTAALRDGMLVLVDAGCEYQGYAADVTRTFPINGRFTPAQRAIYDSVLAALNYALATFGPGSTIHAVNQHVVHMMTADLIRFGILQGDVETRVAEQAYKPFFMHGLSHWLGMDVHDVGDYGSPDRNRILEPGMVLTVEPGLYIAPDADVPEQWRGIAVRIEDNILITATGNDNLTGSLVKDADAIEALMAAG